MQANIAVMRPVVARHERVEKGIRFNVETLSSPDGPMKASTRDALQEVVKKFYKENTLKKTQYFPWHSQLLFLLLLFD